MKANINTFLPNWKSVVYIFIPGWVGFIPVIILLHHFKTAIGLIQLFEKYEYLFVFYFINAVAIGLICNELGSWIEGWFDDLISCKNPSHSEDWDSYLQLVNPTDNNRKIIFYVIDDVVIRLKFGINLSVALLVVLISFPVFQFQKIITWEIGWLVLFEAFILIFLIIQIKTSCLMAEGLSRYRNQLLVGNN